MKRPDYRTLQALDAVIRERGFERAAQKLCITQSAVSQRIKQLENMFGQPLLVRTVPPRPTEQGQNYWLCCVRLNCWKKSGWAMNKPALRRCCCRWRLTPTVWRPGCFRRWRRCWRTPLSVSIYRWKMKRARKNVCVAARWWAR